MKKLVLAALSAFALCACHHPEVEFVDFDTFHVTSVKSADVFMSDGSLNPEIRVMENSEPEDYDNVPTKLAYANANSIVRDLLGVINSNRLIHIAGTYTGHDVDGSPITLSGKLLLPESGPVKNLMIVSHYTIGANYEAPSETFPMEGIWAAKGYAVVIADYIGFGVTAKRIHPYMHVESTARSVVDMALAVKPYLEHIGRKPESEEVILAGYSQGGATTLAVMDMLQDDYADVFPIKKVYAGGGPYDLAATYDISMEWDQTGIPCAIPMIVQGINEGEHLGLEMSDFFLPDLLAHYDHWINSKSYTVKEINTLMNATALHEIMTEGGRDKHNRETARLYQALLGNGVLHFSPHAPIYLFHSTQDRTVPFVNALKAELWFKNRDVQYDFGEYGKHGTGCVRFLINVYKDL
ncbi:MAG: alpha/beta hydrolase [Bacteroidales bacterium]|nr:alpha/beta hydrolase [Bacteroidales bacterium]